MVGREHITEEFKHVSNSTEHLNSTLSRTICGLMKGFICHRHQLLNGYAETKWAASSEKVPSNMQTEVHADHPVHLLSTDRF